MKLQNDGSVRLKQYLVIEGTKAFVVMEDYAGNAMMRMNISDLLSEILAWAKSKSEDDTTSYDLSLLKEGQDYIVNSGGFQVCKYCNKMASDWNDLINHFKMNHAGELSKELLEN